MEVALNALTVFAGVRLPEAHAKPTPTERQAMFIAVNEVNAKPVLTARHTPTGPAPICVTLTSGTYFYLTAGEAYKLCAEIAAAAYEATQNA